MPHEPDDKRAQVATSGIQALSAAAKMPVQPSLAMSNGQQGAVLLQL
jgi:hypothetical protein